MGINHNKFSTSLHLWGRNNNVLDDIQWKFSCECQNGGNNGGNMMYANSLDHGDLGEHILVLTKFARFLNRGMDLFYFNFVEISI